MKNVWPLKEMQGVDLIIPQPESENAKEHLQAAGALAGDEATWEVLRIEAGWPLFGKDIDADRLVMEVGRTRQAISYAKGCYLGQEPIVMARDRGVVQRGLVGLLLGAEPAPLGSLLYRDSKEVGRTASCVVSPTLGQAIALAYARHGSQAPGTVREVEVGGARR